MRCRFSIKVNIDRNIKSFIIQKLPQPAAKGLYRTPFLAGIQRRKV